jgi:hypothetical protein
MFEHGIGVPKDAKEAAKCGIGSLLNKEMRGGKTISD